ncbi:MAG: NHL repeat-containing protein [Chloroflexota bacterium]
MTVKYRRWYRSAAACLALVGASQVLPASAAIPGRRIDAGKAFTHPTSLAFDLNRNAYLTDAGTGRIDKLTASGKMLARWGKHGNTAGDIGVPSGVTADASGHIYISDSRKNHVEKLGYGGKLLATWGAGYHLSRPTALAVDAAGNVYLTDTGNSRVVKFSPKGVVESAFTGLYNPPPLPRAKGKKKTAKPHKIMHIGKFLHPHGVSVDIRGHIFVSDTGHNRIVELAASGEPLRVWGGAGSSRGRLNTPMGLAVSPSGSIWVADAGNNRIEQFSTKGVLSILGSGKGSASNQFSAPGNVAFDSKRTLYVVDTGNSRVLRFSLKGKPLGPWG